MQHGRRTKLRCQLPRDLPDDTVAKATDEHAWGTVVDGSAVNPRLHCWRHTASLFVRLALVIDPSARACAASQMSALLARNRAVLIWRN